ncbi:hypothetical protein [Actinomadura bangladeshensis]|uniref:Uncharacterized protein n=1 Tax=Actinomadura bangladeshensis TaxID=453573 RepID=A0A6L9QQW1_9ACTN|nr:hypothetical protein [Actinomadura bangladeshensis]NEA27302.1 hypothetical protein [Actinomadura bangladeshensis]
MPEELGGGGLRRRRETGAAAIEYAVLVGIASALLVALLLLLPNSVGSGVREALCKIFGGNCTAQPFQYKPPVSACIVTSDSKKIGATVTVFSIKAGQNLQFVKIKMGDGKVRLMIVPNDYKLGAEAEVGGKLQFGKGSYGGKIGGSVEGSLNFKYGDTWVFPDEKAAGDFLDDMKWDLARREGEKASPGLWVFDKLTGWEPRTRDPDFRQWEVGVEGLGKLAAGFGDLTTDEQGERKVKDRATGLEAEGKIGDGVIVTKDSSGSAADGYPLTSYTFQVKGGIKLGAKAVGFGPSGEASYTGQTKVTLDKDGRLKSMTWITTQESNDTTGFKNPGGKTVTWKGTGKKVSVTTTTVSFDDTNRAIGEKWIHDNAFMIPLQTVRNTFDENGALTTADPGPDGDPMDRLIYERGLTNRNVYAGDVDEFKIGAEIAAEVKFGIEGGYEGETQNIVGSQYLGPPQNGERTFVDWPECAKN